MKKIKLVIATLISLLVVPGIVNAASGSIKVTGANTTVVGNNVTVTVKLSTGASWEMDLNYDKSYLQLVSGGGEAGGTNMVNTSTGKPNRTYTFTFKALKKGTTTIKVGSYYVVGDDFQTVSISSSAKTLKIMTQEELEASYSKDNNLKSLAIEGFELSPVFSKDVLDYTVNVPEGTTSVNVVAAANDSKASISGDGVTEVTEGANNITVVVRAENGSEKKYNVVVNVIDENPINVKINNINYTVIKLRNNYVCPELFTDSVVKINEFDVPTCYNEKINYTLVGLKKDDGTVENFVYDNGKYTKYSEVTGTSLKIIAIPFEKEINGLTRSEEIINDVRYEVFKFSDSSRFYVLYGMNVETGEKDFYMYDTENKTFSVYNTEYIDYLINQNKIYLYVIIAFGSGLFLLLICTISLAKKKSGKKIKKQEKNNSDIIEEKEDINELKEIDSDKTSEIYNLLENEKNSKKESKKKEKN